MKKTFLVFGLIAIFSGALTVAPTVFSQDESAFFEPQTESDFFVGPQQQGTQTGTTQGNQTGTTQGSQTGTTQGTQTGTTQGSQTGTTQGTQTGIGFTVPNVSTEDSIMCLLFRLLSIFMNIFAVIAGLYILYSGFKFVAAQGNPTKLSAARLNFIHVIIGTALILGAWGIINLVVNTINEVLDEPIAGLPSNAACNGNNSDE